MKGFIRVIEDRNKEIREYISEYFSDEDEALSYAKKSSNKASLPKIAITENTGKFLYLLAKLKNPHRVLEIGTLGGYSTLWFAKACPQAKIITLEIDPEHGEVARQNFIKAGVNHRIELIVGDAHETLKRFITQNEASFDLIFLDAEKEGYVDYLEDILQLSKPGTLLITDNLIPRGNPINKPHDYDFKAIKTYEYNKILSEHKGLETILVPTLNGEDSRIDALGISLIV